MTKVEAEIAYQQELLNANIEIQENERKRIASELHDALMGQLVAIKMHQENNSPIAQYANLINTSITMVRDIAHDLSPPFLESSTLKEVIQELSSPFELNIAFSFKFDQRSMYHFSEEFKLQMARILQETLHNILKHAKASCVTIHYRESKEQLAIKISDNGKGFKVKYNQMGLGYKNIQSRVQYLKGIHRIHSKVNVGTSALYIFKLPCV